MCAKEKRLVLSTKKKEEDKTEEREKGRREIESSIFAEIAGRRRPVYR